MLRTWPALCSDGIARCRFEAGWVPRVFGLRCDTEDLTGCLAITTVSAWDRPRLRGAVLERRARCSQPIQDAG